jgi:large subunit ribosomal protein L30
MAQKNDSKLVVTLKKSLIGCSEKQRANVRGLGLRKRNHQVEVLDTPENRGMINKVSFLLLVETK